MARRRGWAGSPPATDHEARERILAVAIELVSGSDPAAFSLAGAAAQLGVTRQTVYRYFASAEQLFEAVAVASAEVFVDELAARLAGIDDPADWVVEAIGAAIETLPNHPNLTLLMQSGRVAAFARTVTSVLSRRISAEMVDRASVDWAAHGLDERALAELSEFSLRLIQSLMVDPAPHRSAAELRGFLHRWIAPAVRAASSSHATSIDV